MKLLSIALASLTLIACSDKETEKFEARIEKAFSTLKAEPKIPECGKYVFSKIDEHCAYQMEQYKKEKAYREEEIKKLNRIIDQK